MTLFANKSDIRRVLLETARARELHMPSADPSILVYNEVVTKIFNRRNSETGSDIFDKNTEDNKINYKILSNEGVANLVGNGITKDDIQRLGNRKADADHNTKDDFQRLENRKTVDGHNRKGQYRGGNFLSKRKLSILCSHFRVNFQEIETNLGNPKGKRKHLIENWVPRFTKNLHAMLTLPAPKWIAEEFFASFDRCAAIYNDAEFLNRLHEAQEFHQIVHSVRESGSVSEATATWTTCWCLQRILMPRHSDLLLRAAPLLEPANSNKLKNIVEFYKLAIRIIKERHEFAMNNRTGYSSANILAESVKELREVLSMSQSSADIAQGVAEFQDGLTRTDATIEKICRDEITVGDFVMSNTETQKLAISALNKLYAGG